MSVQTEHSTSLVASPSLSWRLARRWALLAALVAIGCSSDKATGTGAADGGNATPDAAASADSSVSSGVRVTLADGDVEADLIDGVRRYLKIPFAKPPVGDLRWKAPVKNDPWTGVRHETSFTEGCAQAKSSQGPASNNEDCLYLNVWAPEVVTKKAPVMVWIHGGGNFAGAAGDTVPVATPPMTWYDGQYFARLHGVIVVSVDYRLGPLGFFTHPALGKEKSPLGNQGLLDQRRSLEWVRDNIAKFGGDPKNVTIFGESAGSADVCFHVTSPGSRDLFHRAISESGGCTTALSGGKVLTAADAAPGMTAFTKALGCDTAADTLACLRAKPIEDIMANAQQPDLTNITASHPLWSFPVVVDGDFLPDQPRTLFEQGNVAKVPYILGSNEDEGTLFLLGATAPASDADYAKALTDRFGADGPAILAQYPVSRFAGDYQGALARVIGDSGLVCGTHDTARRAAKAGLPVYMYDFDIPWAILPDVLHVSHASEISHVFGNPYLPKPDADSQAVGVAMNAYWATFARTGDPNGAGAPATWPKFAPDANDDDERLQLDGKFETLKSFRKADCAFWRGLFDKAWAG